MPAPRAPAQMGLGGGEGQAAQAGPGVPYNPGMYYMQPGQQMAPGQWPAPQMPGGHAQDPNQQWKAGQ